MTTPLFLLRCVQLGISIRDLDFPTIGLVNDMYADTATMLIKDIRKWRLRRTSTNFNQQFIINFARYKSGFGKSILKGIKVRSHSVYHGVNWVIFINNLTISPTGKIGYYRT